MSDLDIDRKPSRPLWILAAVGALVLHLGCGALAFAHLQGDTGDEYLGAQGDIGIELTSATAEDTDLPAGPDTDASVASPALPEQKAEVKETDLPKDTPTETEDPDRVVTTTEVRKSPRRTIRRSRRCRPRPRRNRWRRKPPPGRRSRARGSTSIRRWSIRASARIRAKLLAKWRGQLSAYLNLHKRYPEVRNARAATVKVGFVIDRMGHVVSMRVIEGSGDSAYRRGGAGDDPASPIRCRSRRRWRRTKD